MAGILEIVLRTRVGQFLRGSLGRLWDEPTRVLGDRQAAIHRDSFAIPNRLVQTWESNSFGRRHWESIERFRDLNPDIDFTLLNASERNAFMSSFGDDEIRDIYFRSKFAPMRVDIFRYAYIWTYGGYYLDISMQWTKPLSELHNKSDTGFIGFEGNRALFVPSAAAFGRLRAPLNLACIWGFGFIPQHEIPRLALEHIKSNWRKYETLVVDVPKAAIISLTGPVAFTCAVWGYLDSIQDDTLSQTPNDFGFTGLVHKGAGYRHLQVPSYAKVRDSGLFLD